MMLTQKPDAISVMASPAASIGLIVKQAREPGFKGRFVALHQIDSAVVVGIAGKDNTEGMWVHGYVQTPLPEKLRRWQQRYTRKFGE
jgi:branched-chain amino acid transport system substrate-binding protein